MARKWFRKQVSVITGAASGIGRALAVEMARRGSALALSDVNAEGLEETAAAAREHKAKVLTEVFDVSDRAAFEAHGQRVLDALGQVDVVVNNAGVALSESVLEMTYEDLEWIIGVNLWGVIHGTKTFLPHMVARDRGQIVNISSVFGIIAAPTQSAYNITKFAVRGFSESLRQELAGTGVGVTVVHPGGIKTDIVRNGRIHRDGNGETDVERVIASFDRMAMTPPEKAAKAIARGIQRRRPRVLIGPDAMLIDRLQRRMPVAYDRIVCALSRRF